VVCVSGRGEGRKEVGRRFRVCVCGSRRDLEQAVRYCVGGAGVWQARRSG